MAAKIEPDRLLLAKIAQGGEKAFYTLYQRCADALFGYALVLSGERTIAEDILQEVFLMVIQKAGELHKVENLSNYLYKSVQNQWRNHARRRQREQDVLQKAGFKQVLIDPEKDERADDETLDRLNRALAGLPVRQRELIMLKNYNGLTFRDIAVILEEPLQTVATRHRAAVEKLKERFSHGQSS
ncbi:RNA polymerase sigma factor [Planctomycetota bacterium]